MNINSDNGLVYGHGCGVIRGNGLVSGQGVADFSHDVDLVLAHEKNHPNSGIDV